MVSWPYDFANFSTYQIHSQLGQTEMGYLSSMSFQHVIETFISSLKHGTTMSSTTSEINHQNIICLIEFLIFVISRGVFLISHSTESLRNVMEYMISVVDMNFRILQSSLGRVSGMQGLCLNPPARGISMTLKKCLVNVTIDRYQKSIREIVLQHYLKQYRNYTQEPM
ncbi:hypothetical protein NPIL_624701 [Nephila pilipes]|uniref:Uncharacterized protein n=1 Tax=Nephila pilipes TaxID=299642 RepID=A0A8X6TIY6_NEPPI|nr:hypothetical protein NPIL_624701 [Nephila pilipes]